MDVLARFLRYVSFDTQSSETSGATPSTEKQRVLAALLESEMRELGMTDVTVDQNGYVYGRLPASKGREKHPVMGLLAHMDTSPSASGAGVKPRVVRYDGGDVELGHGQVLSAAVFPALSRYIGEELIVTDGATLLGADDKAGVAEIMSACAYLIAHPEVPHGPISVAFTPDEEIGEGMDHFDTARFAADYAYTVDGGELGEIEYENFNAAGATVTVTGVNIHPGSAKNKMKNAILLGAEWMALLPPAETPAHTEGYEGFFHVHAIRGDENETVISLLVRDHDRETFEARKALLARNTDFLNAKYGAGTFALTVRDSYYNMREMILPHPELIENAKRAMESVGVTPVTRPIRGGTDGARLSFMGVPCPNLSTGGLNFHGVHECIPAGALSKMVEVLTALAAL